MIPSRLVKFMLDGTAALPGFPFALDLDTGLYRSGTDELSIATAGAQRFKIGSTGIATFLVNPIVTNTAPGMAFTDTTGSAKSLTIAIDGNAANFRESAGAASSLLVLDLANNRVGVAMTPTVPLDVTGAAKFSATIVATGNVTANNALIGNIFGADFAAFGHVTPMGSSNYALLAQDEGSTYLNAAAGKGIYFRIANSTKVTISAAGNFLFPSTVGQPASLTGGIVMGISAAPTGNTTDGFSQYAADQVAGNTCPHFRTELGQIIKLFQSTGIADADGTLASATTKINAILAVLEATGFTAVA